MVKSNKFDYTGRTSSGVKLGKSIAADLEKRADKKQREAQKSSSRLTFKSHFPVSHKTRKEREKSSDTDKEGKDTSKHEQHKLDLRVPGKSLGDDGFALLCDGLEKALIACGDLALIDFNATDNALTTRSLARLAPIIRESKFNLQTLDLSKNNFKVETPVEMQEWEQFLNAFHDSMTLRRLDLSNNLNIGPRALEILARVYNREPFVDPLPAGGAQSMLSLPDDETFSAEADEDSVTDGQLQEGDDDLPRCANGKTLADTWVLGYRRGLRSLPYLTLTNIGLTDTGALFLSYIVEQHHYPTQLITEINATDATSQIRTYRQDANLKGIDWDGNSKTLGKDGLHLLQCAEKVRARNVLGDTDSITSSTYEMVRFADVPDQNGPRKYGSTRRSSLRSMHSIEYGMYDKADIGSARKKIQRSTIVHEGAHKVAMWHAALKVIACSRRLYIHSPEPRNQMKVMEPSNTPDETTQERSMSDIDMSGSVGSLTSFEELRSSFYGMSLKNNLPPIEENHQSKMTYAATLMTTSPLDSEEPILAITDVTNTPTVPTVQSSVKILSTQRKDCCTPEDFHKPSETMTPCSKGGSSHGLEGPVEREDGPEPWKKYQVRRMQDLREVHGGESDGYRDASLRCQMPLPVCLQILSHAMERHELSTLKIQQQETAFAWGQKHETLKKALEWRKKDASSRILLVLGAAECVDC